MLITPSQREDTPIWLTQPELEALEEAMSGFVRLVREMIPTSSSRDESLREIELCFWRGFIDLDMLIA